VFFVGINDLIHIESCSKEEVHVKDQNSKWACVEKVNDFHGRYDVEHWLTRLNIVVEKIEVVVVVDNNVKEHDHLKNVSFCSLFLHEFNFSFVNCERLESVNCRVQNFQDEQVHYKQCNCAWKLTPKQDCALVLEDFEQIADVIGALNNKVEDKEYAFAIVLGFQFDGCLSQILNQFFLSVFVVLVGLKSLLDVFVKKLVPNYVGGKHHVVKDKERQEVENLDEEMEGKCSFSLLIGHF
jgi:hypothetical protein